MKSLLKIQGNLDSGTMENQAPQSKFLWRFVLGLMLCPVVGLSMSQTAQISVNVVAVDPLSYNVRALPTTSTVSQTSTLSSQTTSATSTQTCKKTIYFNNIPYQISAIQPSKNSSCSISTLSSQTYGIILTDI